MKDFKKELVKYRLARAWDTLDDAKILAENEKWMIFLILIKKEYFPILNRLIN